MVLLRVPKEKRAKTISVEEWVRLPYGRQLSWRLVYSAGMSILLIPLGVLYQDFIFQTRAEVYIGHYMLAWRNGSASDL
jgi:hypothetical protein